MYSLFQVCIYFSFLWGSYSFRSLLARRDSHGLGSTTAAASDRSWQKKLDELLDIDTSCDKRRDIAVGLVDERNEIFEDVKRAVDKRDLKVLAPPSLRFGKAIEGLQAFQRQVTDDIIPEAIRRGPPQIDTEAISKVFFAAPTLIESLREISSDPSMLQSTVDEARREIKNIVKPIPEGLETLKYKVLVRKPRFEIREYEEYSICSTEESMEAGKSFTILADYIFGNANNRSEKLSMTTPVITQTQGIGVDRERMSFVLSDKKTSANAPEPTDLRVKITDVPMEVVAYMEFPGIATKKEINLQSELFSKYLQDEGIEVERVSMKIFQYNPPYTLPWLRTNAILFRVTGSFLEDTKVDSDEFGYFTSPEAGD